MAQRQERLAAELAATQRSMLELRSSVPAAPFVVCHLLREGRIYV